MGLPSHNIIQTNKKLVCNSSVSSMSCPLKSSLISVSISQGSVWGKGVEGDGGEVLGCRDTKGEVRVG